MAYLRTVFIVLLTYAMACRGGAVNPQQQADKLIAAWQAVAIAQEFVRKNGYTKAPGSPPLQPESIEFLPPERWAEFRHGKLMPVAYGYRRGRRGGEPGWTVVFEFRPLPNSATGRAVTMDEFGKNAQIEHVDFLLDAVEVKL